MFSLPAAAARRRHAAGYISGVPAAAAAADVIDVFSADAALF